VHRLQLLWVKSIQPKLAALGHRHDPDLAQHAQMLRYRRLRKPQCRHHLADRMLSAVHKRIDDLAPARLGNGVENVGRGGGSRH
jgi:hypothetical protein